MIFMMTNIGRGNKLFIVTIIDIRVQRKLKYFVRQKLKYFSVQSQNLRPIYATYNKYT